MRPTHKNWKIWLGILLAAALLRFPGIDWDAGFALHPDERYLVDLSRDMTLFANPCSLDSLYPYGHLPLYLLTPLRISDAVNDPLFSSRLFSGVLSVLLVAVTGVAGRHIGGNRVGWTAALCVMFAPLLLQNAHFYTVDILGTVGVTMALLAVMHKRYAFAGISGAIAVASKLSYLWVWPILVLGCFLHNHKMSLLKLLQQYFMNSLLKLIVWGIVSFIVLSPWMLLDPVRCWSGPWFQLQIVSGRISVPYTQQYIGTMPFGYPVQQMALWGMGPGCLVCGLLGVVRGLVKWRSINRSHRLMLTWILIYGVGMGGLYAKFPRYYMPLYPWVAIAAGMLVFSCFASRSHKVLRLLVAVFCVLPTIFMGFAQNNIYKQPHPWVKASEWLLENLAPGDVIAYEAWDYPLPLLRQTNLYTMVPLPVYNPESPEKRAELDAISGAVDIIVIASRRAYNALSRDRTANLDTLMWYENILNTGRFHAFTKCPKFGQASISDDPLQDAGLPVLTPLTERCQTPYVLHLPRIDESFRVYDAPMVVVLQRE
jgi:4-amino-4-deoxy-L-arabinose transferase-like glycosyltransferase